MASVKTQLLSGNLGTLEDAHPFSVWSALRQGRAIPWPLALLSSPGWVPAYGSPGISVLVRAAATYTGPLGHRTPSPGGLGHAWLLKQPVRQQWAWHVPWDPCKSTALSAPSLVKGSGMLRCFQNKKGILLEPENPSKIGSRLPFPPC